MGEQTDTKPTEADLIVAQSSVKRGVRGVLLAMLGIVGVSGFVVGALSVDLGDVGVVGSALATCGLMLLVGAPMVVVLSHLAKRRGLDIALSAAAMIVLAIPVAIIAALVKWTSQGSVPEAQ